EHGGHVLEVAGDGALLEFPSAVAAVTWALDTQRALSASAGEGGPAALRLRIGINVEDVIVDQDRLIGDDVNGAARVDRLAARAAIVVTQAVRDYIWNKMPVACDDLGERQLKNISRPIRIYRVDTPVGGLPVPSQPHLSWPKRPGVAVLPFRN